MCEIVVMPVTANVEQFVNSNDPRTLCGLAVVAIFRHITNLVRMFAVRVGGRQSLLSKFLVIDSDEFV